jgi:gluconolactonase
VRDGAERIDGKRFNAPNDLVADAAGGIWFTDPAYGREPAELEIGQEAVYWISPDRTTVTRVADALRRPNGIALSPDGNLAPTSPGRGARGGPRMPRDRAAKPAPQ